jgi:hypothetical protein
VSINFQFQFQWEDSVRKLLLLLSLTLLCSVSARGQGTPVIGASCPASGQTGVTAAGIAVTCTQSGGVLVWVNLNAVSGGGGSGGGVTVASPLDTIQASPNCAAAQTRCFQLPASGGILWDCAWSNAASTITCPDAVFTSANTTGFTAFGVNNPDLPGGGPEVTGSVVQWGASGARATLTYISSTQVSISPNTTTGSCTYSGNQGCMVLWYNLADSVFTSAHGAAAASPDCTSLNIAAGVYGISTANFNTAPSACKLGVGIARTGPGITGAGMGSTILVLDPAFSFASCTAGNSGAACLMASGGMQLRDFQIFGGCNPVGGTHNNNLVELDSGIVNTTSLISNVSFSCFGGTTTGLVGLMVYNNTPQPSQGLWLQAFGSTSLSFTATSASTGMEITNFFAEDCYIACVNLTQASTFLVENNAVLGPSVAASSNIVILGGGSLLDFGGAVGYGSTNQATASNGIAIGSNSTVNLIGTAVAMPSTNTQQAIAFSGTGATLHCRGCQIAGGTTSGGAFQFNSSATNRFFDDCGNTYKGSYLQTGGTGNNVYNGGCSITGTILTTAKVVLSAGWGTTAAVTAPTGATSPVTFTVTNSGTTQGASPTITYTFPTPYLQPPLFCTATQVGGTNAIGTFSAGTPTGTSVVFTYSLTPTASDTEFVQVSCSAQ